MMRGQSPLNVSVWAKVGECEMDGICCTAGGRLKRQADPMFRDIQQAPKVIVLGLGAIHHALDAEGCPINRASREGGTDALGTTDEDRLRTLAGPNNQTKSFTPSPSATHPTPFGDPARLMACLPHQRAWHQRQGVALDILLPVLS